MDTLMADNSLTVVVARDLGSGLNGIADLSSQPTGQNLATYVRDNPTAYFYCWDSTGKILQLTSSSACPASPY